MKTTNFPGSPKANPDPLPPTNSKDSTTTAMSSSSSQPCKALGQHVNKPSQPPQPINLEQSPLAIPEILSKVLSFVDRQQLRQCQLVSRFWFQCSLNSLWRWVEYPEVTQTFLQELNKHGARILCLQLKLHSNMSVHMVVPSELTRILQLTPRVKHFALELTGPAPPQTTVAIFRVISDLFGLQLATLGLSMFDISKEAAMDFFSNMKKIRSLSLALTAFNPVVSALLESDVAQNLASFSSTNINALERQEEIGDALLNQMAEMLPKLESLQLANYPNISSAGVAGFAAKCKGHLTELILDNCNSILATDLAAIVEANLFLSKVNFQRSRSNDSVLLKLTTPATRAGRLRKLYLGWSDHVTSNGIKSVVQSCSNLETLNVSNCKGVTMSIFDEPWSSTRIEVLSFGTSSLQTQLSDLGGDEVKASPTGWDSTLKKMYSQLQKFSRMRELNLSRVGSDARLFELGKSCIDSLTCLEQLTIACNMEQTRTIIWLGTRIPTLTKLVLEGRVENIKLLEDIRAVNNSLTLACKTDPLFMEELLGRERRSQVRALFNGYPGSMNASSTPSVEDSEDDSIVHHTEFDGDATPDYDENSENDVDMSVLDEDLDDTEDEEVDEHHDLDQDEDLDDTEDEEVDEHYNLDQDEESDYPMEIDSQEDPQAGESLMGSEDDEPTAESDEPVYESEDEPECESEPAVESDEPVYESDHEPGYESEPAIESDEPVYESEDEPVYESEDEPVYESEDEPAYESGEDEPGYESDEQAYESSSTDYST